MMIPSIRVVVKEEVGHLPHLCIYAVLEWVLIAIMLVNGCVSFLATQFAKYCELRSPCLVCSRIDHVFAERDEAFHYNETMCEVHRRDISYLAYCHNHKKLSDIRKMCEACLLSFATEKESDGDTYKSLVGILHKDIESLVEDRSNKCCCCCGIHLNAGHPKSEATDSQDSILHRLKRQVRLDCKSLMALYMELDEERNASAVAANNAMAMITRLQADKAAVQMEALQYQRMMEEQAEYDQEALQETQKIIRDLENELEAYRHKFGYLEGFGIPKQPQLLDNNLQQIVDQSQPLPSSSSSSSSSSRRHNNSQEETEKQNEVVITRGSSLNVSVEPQSEPLEDVMEKDSNGEQVLKEISESEEDA